jgi:lipopolysaccharide transport system permease protein
MTVQLKEPSLNNLPGAPTVGSYTNTIEKRPEGIMTLWSLRSLIAIMVKRDLFGRYRGSMMGTFWTIINPVGHLLLYTFVFSIILKVKLGTDASTGNFALYLMAGLLPWGTLAESLMRATGCIPENPNLVKRVVFPLEILPLVLVISSLASEMVALAPLILAACIYLHAVPYTLIFLPLIMLSQTMFVLGLSWLLAALGVFVQDIKHAISLTLSVWMYATPIVYPEKYIPKALHFLVWLNPMAGIVGDYRRVMLQQVPPDWTMFASYTIVAFFLFLGGFYFFDKTKRSFADVI